MSDETRLIITADLGVSLIKGFWSCENANGSLRGFKTLASAVQECTPSAYERGQFRDSNTSYVKFDDEYWIVGTNAQAVVQVTDASEPKALTATAKVLALVGQVLREIPEELKPALELKILLPLDEMGESAALGDRLGTLLFGFGFDGKNIAAARVKSVSVHPEGYGLVQALTKPGGILMMGHRDISWIHLEGGTISLSASKSFAGFGMVHLLKQTSFALKDELRCSAAIFAAGDTLDDKALLKIACDRDLERLKAELGEARDLVWRNLRRKLEQTSFKGAQQVLASGGNAHYWRSPLKELLGSRLTLGVSLVKEMQEQYPDVPKNSLLYRALDAYGLSKVRSFEGGLIHA